MNTLDGLAKFCSQPWAITQTGAMDWLSTFRFEVPATRAAGKDFFGNDLPSMRVENGTAIIPVKGVLVRGANAIEQGYGAVSHYDIGSMIDEAEGNPSVMNVLFDIDSPGGTTSGTGELADKIAGMTKPTVAYSDGLIGSAAYWLASQCDMITCTSGALIGAVGAIMTLSNVADMLKDMGYEINILTSEGSPLKAAGSNLKRMSDDERSYLKSLVDTHGKNFRNAVHQKRPNIGDDAMQGQVHLTSAGVANGLVDASVSGMSEAASKFPDIAAPTPGKPFPYPGGLTSTSAHEAAWRASAQLQREFPDAASYAGYMNSRGRRVFGFRPSPAGSRTSKTEIGSRTPPRPQTPAPAAGNGEQAAWEAEWNAASPSSEIRAEFPTAGSYAAFMKHDKLGRVRNHSRKKTQ